MARHDTTPTHPARWPVLVAAAGFFAAETVVVAGAASPFRLPKEAAILAAICAAVGLAVFSAARNRTVVLPRGRLVAALTALPAILAISSLWSTSPLRSLESALLTTIWILGTLWIATVGAKGRRILAIAAAAGVSLSILVMLLQLAGISVFEFAAPFATARLSLTGLTGNPADLAMAAVLLLPLVLTLGEQSPKPWIYHSLAILFALGALLTQTLTGIAALGAVALVWLFHKRSRKIWFTVSAVAVVLIASALAAGLGDRLEREANRIRSGNWYELLSARGDGWTAAREMIREHPVVGVGSAAYTHQYYPSRLGWLTRNGGTGGRDELASHFRWAHCDLLQVVAELGIPGLLWMVFFAWAVITSGWRAGPVTPLMAAAVMPFLALHYPTHLAVGLAPISLVLAHIIARSEPPTAHQWRRFRRPAVVLVALFCAMGAYWQLRRVAVDVWMGGHEIRMSLTRNAPAEHRAQLGRATEAQVLSRLDRLEILQPTLWRTVGRARLLQGDARGAESAFRESFRGWPHEDAEFYLGLSLIVQGRRNEALSHLSRVCRTNPKLIELVNDEAMQRTLKDVLDAYQKQ